MCESLRTGWSRFAWIGIIGPALVTLGCDEGPARRPDPEPIPYAIWWRDDAGDLRTLRVRFCWKDPDCPSLTNGDLEKVGEYESLTELYVRGSEITDEGLKHLVGLINLRVLELDTPQVTDAGFGHLLGLERLLVLRLVETQVTEQGIERFEEAVPGCDVRVKRSVDASASPMEQ